MYKITLFGTDDDLTTSNNLVLESSITGGTYESVEMNCYEINDERSLISQNYNVIQDISFNDRLFRGKFSIVSERLSLADYKSLENDLFTVFQKTYLYLKVENYEIVSHPENYVIAIELIEYSIDKSGGKKWFNITFDKKETD